MRVAFGEFVLDSATGELVRGSERVEIQPKSLALLQYLIAHADRVVSKAELLGNVWPDQFVTDGVLKRAVHALRVAVGDSGSSQSIIQTRPRVGYRFVAAFTPPGPDVSDPALTTARDSSLGSDFVGRTAPRKELRAAWERVESGRGAVVLISGPPGIGKTRLAEELSANVLRSGGMLLRGWCDDSRGAPPFWPWLQIARALHGDEAAEISTIDSAPQEAHAAHAAELQERSDRTIFEKQDALTRLLIGSARSQPLLIVLEDLHWADRATLGALAFLSREISDARILVVGTFRDDELTRDHPLVHEPQRTTPRDTDLRIHLRGLSAEEVRELLAAIADSRPSQAAIDEIHDRTEGNPLFIREIARFLTATASIDAAAGWTDSLSEVPPGIASVLERRLQQLSPISRTLLEVAALIGIAFERRLLSQVAGRDLGTVADALDSATVLGVVREGREDPAECEFVHALMRDAVLRAVPPSRRLELQQAVLAELERESLPNPRSLARLADHANAVSRAGGDARKAIAYDRLASWYAASQYANDDCAMHAERALVTLRAVESRADVEVSLSIGLRIDRARAANVVRDSETALENAEAAVRLASGEQDYLSVALAALSLDFDLSTESDLLKRLVTLLELAEQHAPPGSETAIRLIAARVTHLSYFVGTGEVRARDGGRALEWARARGERAPLVCALTADLTANWSRRSAATRLAYSRELYEAVEGMPDRFGDVATLLASLIEHGDIERWERVVGRMKTRIMATSANKYYAYYAPLYAATRALWRGELSSAEGLIKAASKCLKTAGPPWGRRARATQIFQLRCDQGRLAELEAGLRWMRTQFPSDYSASMVFCFLLCEQGRHDEARPIFEEAFDKYDFGSDINQSITLTVMASVCAHLGDAKRAERLYPLLLPLKDLVAVDVGCWLCQGSMQWPLGLASAASGRTAEAEAHFERAISRNRTLGMRTYEARAALHLATLLATNGASEKRERAAGALDAALTLARAIGMPALIAEGEALESSLLG